MMDANDNAQEISVIVSLLNEYKNLPKLHAQLGHFLCGQIIFVDGGSTDGSWQWLQENILKRESDANHIAIQSQPVRALQMNQGAELAECPFLLFLHADSFLSDGFANEITKGLRQSTWGRFDITFVESDFRMKIIAWFMNNTSSVIH